MRQGYLAFLSTATICYISLSVASPASAATFLSFTSEPDDRVGQGMSATFTRDDGHFDISYDSNVILINFNDYAFGGDSSWYLDLKAPQGTSLVPGIYEGATGFPFQNPSQPGLSFIIASTVCTTLTGKFNIQNIAYNSYGEPTQLQVDFEQHCEGAEAALFGQFAFDRNEFDEDNLTRLLGLTNKIEEYETALYYFSQPGDYVGGGLAAGGEVEQILTPETVSFESYHDLDNVGFYISGTSKNAPEYPISWGLHLAAPQGSALTPGLYDRALSFPTQPSNRPGIGFSGDGRGCAGSGRFQVLEASYGSDGIIEKFDALFEQHCDVLAIGPSTFGRIRYNATLTPSEPTPPESVPEPTTILGLLSLGGLLIAQRKRSK